MAIEIPDAAVQPNPGSRKANESVKVSKIAVMLLTLFPMTKKAVRLVVEDTDGKHFAKSDGQPVGGACICFSSCHACSIGHH